MNPFQSLDVRATHRGSRENLAMLPETPILGPTKFLAAFNTPDGELPVTNKMGLWSSPVLVVRTATPSDSSKPSPVVRPTCVLAPLLDSATEDLPCKILNSGGSWGAPTIIIGFWAA